MNEHVFTRLPITRARADRRRHILRLGPVGKMSRLAFLLLAVKRLVIETFRMALVIVVVAVAVAIVVVVVAVVVIAVAAAAAIVVVAVVVETA